MERVDYDPTIKVSENTTKTPLVKQSATGGVVYSCIYSDNNQIALVAMFCEPELLKTSGVVSVRLHSSCANSDILGSFDCDCRSQLLRSLEVLRERKGVLIHLFQEGRGAGIFAKYLGMYTMQTRSLSTYNAYRELAFDIDGRSYSLALSVLRDLGIDKISLLSNNPKKISAFQEVGFSVTPEPLLGTITPQNFGYLFSKFYEGQHKVHALFPDKGDYYFCKTVSSVGPFGRTWIIDGDDTLWEDNIVYVRIVDTFVEYCRPFVPEMTDRDIRQMIDDTEEKTIPEHGFGAPGFQRSLETVYELIKAKNNAIPRPSELFDSIVPTLRNQPEVLTTDVVKVLSDLAKRGDGLVLYTQGPFRIQFEKIARSGLAEYFHALCVVRFKKDSSLRRLQHDCDFGAGDFVAVGNSLRSDIEPALEVGLKAVHFNNPNSWHIQNLSKLEKSQYLRIDSLSELLELSI